MKGYFPRLIEQTGITFGSGGDFKLGFLESPRTGSKKSDKIIPIHIEDRKMVEPQTDQTVEKIHRDVGEASGKSVQVTKVENIQHSIEERFENKIAQEPQNHVSEKEKLKQRKRETEEKKFTVFDRDIQTLPERSRLGHENDTGESLEREETVENGGAAKDYTGHLGKFSVSANQELKKDLAFQPGAKSDDRISKEQIWQATFKEVREWVAGTPVKGSKKINNRDKNKTVHMDREILTSLGDKQIPVASFPGPAKSQQREEPEIHDFHLSIGTISLTVKEPQKEIQRNEPAQIRRERKSMRETNSSRLSRHYVRI